MAQEDLDGVRTVEDQILSLGGELLDDLWTVEVGELVCLDAHRQKSFWLHMVQDENRISPVVHTSLRYPVLTCRAQSGS